ncbi:hypothetical protein B0H63DRAFT_515550 [Podospora didyma]|uniref:Uncharacterized protein n=1 Tax=Podospora didyma TaxID=330526 RepID=A0AAE0K0H0_9PEZI|nr:hypothetical protein B0H63DRAFT_515550 [Podospora didyma]
MVDSQKHNAEQGEQAGQRGNDSMPADSAFQTTKSSKRIRSVMAHAKWNFEKLQLPSIFLFPHLHPSAPPNCLQQHSSLSHTSLSDIISIYAVSHLYQQAMSSYYYPDETGWACFLDERNEPQYLYGDSGNLVPSASSPPQRSDSGKPCSEFSNKSESDSGVSSNTPAHTGWRCWWCRAINYTDHQNIPFLNPRTDVHGNLILDANGQVTCEDYPDIHCVGCNGKCNPLGTPLIDPQWDKNVMDCSVVEGSQAGDERIFPNSCRGSDGQKCSSCTLLQVHASHPGL